MEVIKKMVHHNLILKVNYLLKTVSLIFLSVSQFYSKHFVKITQSSGKAEPFRSVVCPFHVVLLYNNFL